MAQIYKGRYTADTDESFVVFIIGMRVNRLFAFRKWLPALLAMNPMLKELYTHPELGFLGGEFFLYGGGPALVTYWRSFEDLEKFARSQDEPHLSAWKAFNRDIGSDGSVGIWHETYLVNARQYESVYSNMPRFGLARATRHVPAVGVRETARLRLGDQNTPAVPSPVSTPAQPS